MNMCRDELAPLHVSDSERCLNEDLFLIRKPWFRVITPVTWPEARMCNSCDERAASCQQGVRCVEEAV